MYGMFDVSLPHWPTTIRVQKAKLCWDLKMDVNASTSIINLSIFLLSLKRILGQEISNPLFSPMINYYPQDTGG
jgi:hypothetical protein